METFGLPAHFSFSNDFCDFSKKGPDRSPEAPGAPQGPSRDPPGDPQRTPRGPPGTILDRFLSTFSNQLLIDLLHRLFICSAFSVDILATERESRTRERGREREDREREITHTEFKALKISFRMLFH